MTCRRSRARGARVIASLWGHTVDDYREGMSLLASAAPELVAVELNLSCPNTKSGGEMFATNEKDTASVVARRRRGRDRRAALRQADTGGRGPDLDRRRRGGRGSHRRDARQHRARAPGRRRGTPAGAGEPRRRPLGAGDQADRAPGRARRARRAIPSVPIIGTGGVSTGVDAVEMLLAGATAVGVGTATFAEPRATLRILGELDRWCQHRGVAAVRELIGAMRRYDTEVS